MNTIEINGVKYKLPSRFDELTEADMLRISGQLLLPWDGATQYTILRLLLPDVPVVLWVKMTDDQLLAVLSMLDFLQKPAIPKPFPVFRMGLRWFWLPAKERLRAVDFAISEPLLKAYIKTGDEKWLNMLVATLCRPKKWWILLFPWLKKYNLNWDGDVREKYHSAVAQLRSQKLTKVPMYKKMAVVWWIVQYRWELSRDYRNLFSKPGEGSGDWIHALMSLAEKQLFGDFEKVMQTNFSTILKYLSKPS